MLLNLKSLSYLITISIQNSIAIYIHNELHSKKNKSNRTSELLNRNKLIKRAREREKQIYWFEDKKKEEMGCRYQAFTKTSCD